MTTSPTVFQFAQGALGLLPRWRPLARALRDLALARPGDRGGVADFLEATAARHPHTDALRTPEGSITYGDFNREANRLAHALRKRGIVHGDRVAISMANGIPLLRTVAALVKVGAVPALLGEGLRAEGLRHALATIGPRLVMHDRSDQDFPRSEWEVFGPGSWEQVEGEPATYPRRTEAVRLGDAAFLVFTSGTTGLPKASIMSHLRWLKAARVFGGACLNLGPGDVVYAPLPLSHNQALTVGWGGALVHGATFAT
ncbi:MAG: AMP-binding protein [Myxococcales bacterium]|nr:AMP-binding protein [Myxococcales bacterium]